MAQTAAESAFAVYAKLSADEKREFRAMLTGYEFSKQVQVNAGRKSAETKRERKPKPASQEANA
jgi:hypothetical protein